MVRHRLVQYHEKAAPVVDFYTKQGLLNRIAGGEAPEKVEESIRKLISTLSLEEGS